MSTTTKKHKLLFADDLHDDTSSESSSRSGNYSNMKYISGDDQVNESNTTNIPTIEDKTPIINNTATTKINHKSTRFCPEEKAQKHKKQQSVGFAPPSTLKDRRGMMDSLRLMRNRSLVDIRSQLLHRSLVEEVYKRRMFSTIGAVENIGFQSPYDISNKLDGHAHGTKRGGSKNAKVHQGQNSNTKRF